jgi:hypothetical protein
MLNTGINMGANVSTDYVETINDFVTDQSTKIVNSKSLTTSNAVSSNQVQNVNIISDDVIDGCLISLSQDAKVINQVYSSIDNTEALDMIATLKQAFEKTITKSVEQGNEGINLGQANIDNTTSKTLNKNYADLSTEIMDTIVSNLNNAVNANQNQQINVTLRKGMKCNSSGIQGIVAGQNVDISNIITSSLKSDKVQKLVTDASNTIKEITGITKKQTNKGVDPAAIMGAMVGAAVAAFIVPIVIGFIVTGLISKGVMSAPGKVFGKNSTLAPAARKKQIAIYAIIGFIVLLIVIILIVVSVNKSKARKKAIEARKKAEEE